MQKVVPEIDFIKYLKAFVPAAYSLTPDRMVINTDMYYFGNLSSFIQKHSRQDFHSLFRASVSSSYSGRLHSNFTVPSRRFSNMLSGKDPDTITPRWRTCLNEVDGTLGHILSAAYIERAFSSGDKALGDQIIKDLKSVFSSRILKLDWMTEDVKQLTIKKGTRNGRRRSES
jgi:endothelin-converting enzyme